MPSLNGLEGSAREHDCNVGFGKKWTLQILGVQRDHLAEPLMGGPFVFPEFVNCTPREFINRGSPIANLKGFLCENPKERRQSSKLKF